MIMRIHPKKIIHTLKKNGGKVRKTAKELGISPGTVINWRGRDYLKRYSTRPHTIRGTALTKSDQNSIDALRRARRYGAKKIKHILKISSHHSTIHRHLQNHNFIPKGTSYRRPRYQKTIHMHAKNALLPGKFQMDVKYVTPALSGLPHTCYLYAIMDIFTRMKKGVIYPLLDQGFAIEAVKVLTPQFPFKANFIQTDNGLEFQARFGAFLKECGYEHHYIHKGNPNENAVIERSFRTDEEEFFWRIRKATSIIDLNMQYHAYLHEYNTERPHLSLDMMTPEEKLRSVQNV